MEELQAGCDSAGDCAPQGSPSSPDPSLHMSGPCQDPCSFPSQLGARVSELEAKLCNFQGKVTETAVAFPRLLGTPSRQRGSPAEATKSS